MQPYPFYYIAYGPADEKFPIKHEEKYIDSVMTQCLPIGGSTPSPVTIPAGKPTIGKASVTNYLFGILLGLAIIVFT